MAIQKFKNKVKVEAELEISQSTANRALVTNASKELVASAVTDTELGHLSGVTSSVQDQIDAAVNAASDAQFDIDTHINDTTDAHDASAISSVPSGNLAATDVQAAINELDSEKAAVGHTHVASDITDFAEAAQDAVAAALVDSSSIDFTYDDSLNTITAAVLPAGVDHDALSGFVANEHIDHSTVEIQTGSNSGLSGGGDITSTRSLVVDITGTTAETSADNADEILIWDTSANARRKMTRANFLAGVTGASAGDIQETSFASANNQTSAANITGFAFANGVVRSFKALVSVEIDATADLYESFELLGIQKGSSWDMTVSSTGDDSGIVFSITTAGQIQYTSTDVAGFVAGAIKFRAITTSI